MNWEPMHSDVAVRPETKDRLVERGNGRAAGALTLVVFVLFFLWDYYLLEYGIRPLDLLGWFIMAGGLCLIAMMPSTSRVLQPHNIQLVCVLSLPFLIGALRGAVQGNIKASLAIVLGLVVFGVYYAVRLDKDRILTLTNWLLIIQACGLLGQWAYFKVSGQVLNYHKLMGIEPRVYNESLNYFRPAGLFQEPNSYSITTFMLLLLKFRLSQARDWISYVALATIFISESLWGFACVAVLLVTVCGNYMIRTLAVVILATVIFYADEMVSEGNGLVGISEVAFYRLTNVESDNSAIDRYFTFLNLGDAVSTPQFWLGTGVSTDDFQVHGGANAYSYMIYAYGVVGVIIILVALSGLAERRHRTLCLFGVLFGMTTFPLWSYFYWWSWLGLMGKHYEGDVIKTRPFLSPEIPWWYRKMADAHVSRIDSGDTRFST